MRQREARLVGGNQSILIGHGEVPGFVGVEKCGVREP